MKCPIDNADLVMAERQGIEIDYCPKCRGVWLDRGELDKIIERAAAQEERPRATSDFVPPRDERPSRDYERRDYEKRDYEKRDYDDRDYGDRKRYRKKSLLGEIFDFD